MKRIAAFLLLYIFIFHISTTNALAEQISKPELNSEAAILMDADTGIVLHQKNIHERMYPASITKVMTALVVLDTIGDRLEERITFSPEAVTLPYNSSTIYMFAGDTLTYKEALYALMISSANEVANALAENAGKTYSGFIDMMNRKAELLGAKNTNFVNPSGLHDDNHYTSAYDMALIMREAVSIPAFVDVIGKISYEIPPTEMQSEVRLLNTKNQLIKSDGRYYREYVVGSKTGFVNESMHTLATYAQQDGRNLITVVLRAETDKHYEDTVALMEYGFSSYRYAKILDADNVVASATVVMDPDNPKTNRSIALHAKEDVEGDFPACITDRTIKVETRIPDLISPPIKANDFLGTLLIQYQDITIKEINLYASEGIEIPEPTIVVSTTSAPMETVIDNPSFKGGFSYGFLGEILSNIVSSFSPVQLNPIFYMIIIISIAMIIMGYFIIVIIQSRSQGPNPDRNKKVLKIINKEWKKGLKQ